MQKVSDEQETDAVRIFDGGDHAVQVVPFDLAQ